MNEDFFPLGLAGGKSFCNREKERERLKNNFEKNRHILITSPRRYGKTSLVLKSTEENKLPYTHIDFFMATDINIVERLILYGIGQLITKLIPGRQRALRAAKELMMNLQPSLSGCNYRTETIRPFIDQIITISV
jgi:hypothetical protein